MTRVNGYIIFQDETVLDTVTAKKFEVTGLANGTYTFSVVAIDASGNHSTASSVDATVGSNCSSFTRVLKKLKFIQIRLLQPCG